MEIGHADGPKKLQGVWSTDSLQVSAPSEGHLAKVMPSPGQATFSA